MSKLIYLRINGRDEISSGRADRRREMPLSPFHYMQVSLVSLCVLSIAAFTCATLPAWCTDSGRKGTDEFSLEGQTVDGKCVCPLFPYILLGAAALWFVGATVAYQVKLRRRRGPSREAFVAAFSSGAEPLERIAGVVYDYYSSLAVGRRYAVSPDDSYEDVLRAGPEEIDDDAAELLMQLRLGMPAQGALHGRPSPIATIRDMVHWLDWVRTHQSGDSSL